MVECWIHGFEVASLNLENVYNICFGQKKTDIIGCLDLINNPTTVIHSPVHVLLKNVVK